MEKEKLKCCPFCGVPPTYTEAIIDAIRCLNMYCGISLLIKWNETRELFIKRWNTRAKEPT